MSVVVSGIGRGLVLQSRDWLARRMGVGREQLDWSMGASGIQRVLIGDRYALQSERVIFLPDQDIKIGRRWSGVNRLSGVKVALRSRTTLLGSLFHCYNTKQTIQILEFQYCDPIQYWTSSILNQECCLSSILWVKVLGQCSINKRASIEAMLLLFPAQRVVEGICPSVSVCVCPSRFDLVNTVETKPLCASSLNLADIFTMTRG